MNKKILVAVFFLFFISLFNNCKCPPEQYYDYKSLGVEALFPLKDRLLLHINPVEVIYLAKVTSYASFGGYTYATSVCEKGYAGEKYPIVKICVSSNSDFNDDYLAESDLTNLIKVYGMKKNSNEEHTFDYLKNFSSDYITNLWYLYIEEKPTISKKHTFTVKYEKSNGEIVSGISQEIIWE